MAERSADWMAQARRDLDSARWLMEGRFYEWSCFAAQQSAEKALKAVYQYFMGTAWGYSVLNLLEGLREKVTVPEEVLRCGRLLDRFYIPTRYPNSWESGIPQEYYGEEDARQALDCAEKVLRFGERLLAGPGGSAPAA